jgi:hypothetical protein
MIVSELHQRAAAKCVEDIVTYNYKIGKKVAIPPFIMDAFRTTWEQQQQESKRVGERRKELESLVVEIEKGTWDQDGAKEDFGGTR